MIQKTSKLSSEEKNFLRNVLENQKELTMADISNASVMFHQVNPLIKEEKNF